MRAGPLVLGGLTLLLLGAGCAQSDAASTELSEGQQRALADGVVTQEEYVAAIDGFLACMEDAGYAASEPVLSPVDSVSLLYEIAPSGDPDSYNETLGRCDLAHKSEVEVRYEESQDPVMDPPLLTAVSTCLEDLDYQLTGDEHSAVDLIRRTTGQPMPTMQCVNDAMAELYPDYPRSLSVRW